jgi:hypothetical protein
MRRDSVSRPDVEAGGRSMNRRKTLAAMLAAAAAAFAAGTQLAGREVRAAQGARAWEYRIVTTFIPKPVLEKFNRDRTQVFTHPSLDGPGAEGWELVAAIGDPDNSEYRQFFLKRPR